MYKTILFLFIFSFSAFSQQMRYFEFTVECGTGNWRDSSFIAATDDSTVINEALYMLTIPKVERRIINGPITNGNGGFNHNGDYWFKWSHIPGEWVFTDFATEVCDGCPFTDVDSDTAYWISNVRYFCPWSGKISREIDDPTVIENEVESNAMFYPNPASKSISLNLESDCIIRLVDLCGREIISEKRNSGINILDVSQLSKGAYIIKACSSSKILIISP